MIDNVNEEFEKMNEAFDKEGNLIEGKEFDPEGKISLDEMRGGTFTISNVGAVGGAFSTPIMNFPQAAILGLGKITDEAMVKNGEIVIGKRLPLFLSFDHRLVDGADAARFLNDIMADLAVPENLLT